MSLSDQSFNSANNQKKRVNLLDYFERSPNKLSFKLLLDNRAEESLEKKEKN